MKCNRTRIAPTPSGYLHIGNAFSFLLTQALAQQAGAEILLRIDDMDRQRYRPDYVSDIFETLAFLNIRWQQGPADVTHFESCWSQTHRVGLYQTALKTLREQDGVFACTCPRHAVSCACLDQKFSLDAAGVAWRLKTAVEEPVQLTNVDGGKIHTTLPPSMRHFVVRRKDGLPAYQLTSVVDDLHFGIDLVVRGQDLWASTVAQHVLAQQLGAPPFLKIRFCHHPLLQDAHGQKLSKSAGAASIRHWRRTGNGMTELLAQLGGLLHCPAPVRRAADLLTCLNG